MTHESKIKSIIAWVLSALLSAGFVLAGVMKFIAGPAMARRFEAWGYSPKFALLIGILEVLAGLLVLFPRFAIWGAALIIILMLGATYTHLHTGIGSPLFALIYLAMVVIVAILRWPIRWWPGRE